ncbi:MAG: YIP1 family protein [Roseburia sp.]|nr:YIP1 family protein [Roseburia sp.]MCM1099464.1 YIP1 family protein [Ruminococcus flavefaciens]
MKKHGKWKKILFLPMAVCLMLQASISASANQATSYTYAADEDKNWERTQDAYLPDKTITELGLSSPEDLFIDGDNMLYIADTGNKRVVKYDISAGTVAGILESSELTGPRGIFVTENGEIYVADTGAKAVLIFDRDFNLLNKLTRPDAPIFADTNYEPKRVAVDGGGNVYLIGEGVYNGIIQLAKTGEFLGYFAVNDADLTFSQRLQQILFTRAQLANLMDINPTVFANVFVDQDGIVYSATSGTHRNGMKKHSTNGGNMFKSEVWSFDNLTDVYVDGDGLIYTCAANGYINIYSKSGEEIFEFGSYVTTVDISGLFTSLPSIAVDTDGNIWAVDGTKGYLQSFKPTEYAQTVYTAMNLYEEGRYEEAMEKWNEVLKLNQMSVLAHNGVGKAYLHAEEYEASLEHFKVANNKDYYSQSFWEVRNEWIQKWLGLILGLLIGLLVLKKVVKEVDKRHGGRLAAAEKKVKEKTGSLPVWKDILYALKTPRHPMDCYYEIRKYRQGSVVASAVIYLLFFIDFMAFKTVKGFIYQTVKVEDMDIGSIVLGFFVLLGLFIICNYLVTSINDGDGTFKQIFMIPAYGAMPAMIALLVVTCVSYVLTYNESFLLTLVLLIGIVWSVITIFIGLQTVHDYTFGETIKSIILTVVFMIIVAVIGVIISIMWNSLYTFLASVGKEMIQNVL